MPRVLIVEDQRKILRGLTRGFAAAGYDVVSASDGITGYTLAANEHFDCVVLDRMLPGRNGLDVLGNLRKDGNAVPVLLLTARDAIDDRVTGLEAGADDYLVKPFAFAELLARVRALLRRGKAERDTVLRAGDLEADLIERRASRAGDDLGLRGREFDVLVYLMRHHGNAVTRDMLGRDVWKEPAHALTNVIDVTVTLLRRKLEQPGLPSPIHTVRGVGYILKT